MQISRLKSWARRLSRVNYGYVVAENSIIAKICGQKISLCTMSGEKTASDVVGTKFSELPPAWWRTTLHIDYEDVARG